MTSPPLCTVHVSQKEGQINKTSLNTGGAHSHSLGHQREGLVPQDVLLGLGSDQSGCEKLMKDRQVRAAQCWRTDYCDNYQKVAEIFPQLRVRTISKNEN